MPKPLPRPLMEIKSTAEELRITPAIGGVIVQRIPLTQGALMDPPRVFTDLDKLSAYLFNYYVDTEAELLERAKSA